MAEELMVVLRRSDSCGLGFSLLRTAGLPPIIYDIIENSPAAESGEVKYLQYSDHINHNAMLGVSIPNR